MALALFDACIVLSLGASTQPIRADVEFGKGDFDDGRRKLNKWGELTKIGDGL